MNNRAREFVERAHWFIRNGGPWQTIAELLSMALGEIAELEQAVTATPSILVLDHPRGLVGAELSEVRKSLVCREKTPTEPTRGIGMDSSRELVKTQRPNRQKL